MDLVRFMCFGFENGYIGDREKNDYKGCREMKKNEDQYRFPIDSMMEGVASYRILRDDAGAPADYVFLEVNPAFEGITGLSKEEIIGRSAIEVLKGLTESADRWIGFFGKAADREKHIRFEGFSESRESWYEISAYSMEGEYFVTVFREITENKKAEQNHIDEEIRYRRLFESAKDGILILEADTGTIMNVNPYLIDLLGYSEEDILGKAIWEIGTFKDILASQEKFMELQEKGYIRYENFPLQTADGRRIGVEFISNVYQEGDHKVIQCNIREITKRKRTELFQNLSRNALVILNESSGFHEKIQRILSAVKSMTGLDAAGIRLKKGEGFPYYAQYGFPDEVLCKEHSIQIRHRKGEISGSSEESIRVECSCGLTISDFIDPADSEFTPGGSVWTKDLVSLHENRNREDRKPHSPNQCIQEEYASFVLSPIRKNKEIAGFLQINDRKKDQFNHDEVIALEEIANHIGECMVRNEMTESLRSSEQKLSSILNNITDVIWSLSLPEMNVFYVSPSVEKLYGLPEEAFIQNPALWQEAVHPEDQHLAEKNLAQLYEKGESVRECRIVRPDGSIVWICDKSQLIYDDKNEPVRIEGIASDITDRKLAEESLKKRLEELETIYSISTTVRTAQTLDQMLTLLLDEIMKVLETETGAICLYNPEKETLEVAAGKGWISGLMDDVVLRPGEGIVGQVFSSGEVLVSKEYAKDSRVKYIEKMPKGWGGVCLPLSTDVDIVGVLFISVPLPRVISTGELKLLTSLAEIAGTAVQRIRLFEKNLDHLERIKALRNIDRVIAGSMDLREIFTVILDEVTRILNVDAAAILRISPHTGMLKYEAWRGFHSADPSEISLNPGEGFAGKAAMERKSIQMENLQGTEWDKSRFPFPEMKEMKSYYAVPLINKGRVDGVLEVFFRETPDSSKEWLDFLETLGGQTAIAIDSSEMIHQLQSSNYKLIQAYDSTIAGWARALDLRDKETGDHSQRVTELTVKIAEAMGVNEEELAHIRRGAMLHDIGKMGVSDRILLKPGPLTEEEWEVMHRHPVNAFELLSPIEYLRPALDIPYCHHEKWDGTGYPRGLRKEQIPLAARIFAVADVYDALTSDRPYRKAWSREKAFAHIRNESGKHFDPKVVEQFILEEDQ